MEEVLIEFAKWAFEKMGEAFLKKLGAMGAEYLVKNLGNKVLVIVRKASSMLRDEVTKAANSAIRKSLSAVLIAAITANALTTTAVATTIGVGSIGGAAAGLGIPPLAPFLAIGATAAAAVSLVSKVAYRIL